MPSKYFQDPKSRTPHPRVRTWQAYRDQAGGRVRAHVWREREAIGFSEPILHLEFLGPDGTVKYHDEVPWRVDLDDWLQEVGCRAEPLSSEALRFSMRMRSKFEPLWQEWGDGYFNTVLSMALRQGPFASDGRVRGLLAAIRENRPYDGGDLQRRRDDVEAVFYSLAAELKNLSYDDDDGEAVLVAALSTYLDDRFHVSDRKRLFGAHGVSVSAKKVAALSLAEVLEEVARREGAGVPSSYFVGAVNNIENGDDTSVDVNWPIIDREIAKMLPQGYAPVAIKDAIVRGLEKRLAALDPDVVDEACELLAMTPGGDAETYRRTWAKLPR